MQVLTEKLSCEYALLSEADMRTQLLYLMGEADKELAPKDYGSPAAEEHAVHIRALANQLVFKTSTSDKLAGEAFVFASEIAPLRDSRARRNNALAGPDSQDSF